MWQKNPRAQERKGEAQGVLSYQKVTGIFDNPHMVSPKKGTIVERDFLSCNISKFSGGQIDKHQFSQEVHKLANICSFTRALNWCVFMGKKISSRWFFRGKEGNRKTSTTLRLRLVNEVHPDFVHLFFWGSHILVEVDNILANSSLKMLQEARRWEQLGFCVSYVQGFRGLLDKVSCLKDSVLLIFQPAAVCQIVCDGKIGSWFGIRRISADFPAIFMEAWCFLFGYTNGPTGAISRSKKKFKKPNRKVRNSSIFPVL